jgi:hypothetical protein
MSNNKDASETYHEVPASRSWYLGDNFGPVTKAFLKFYTPTIFILGVAVTAITLLTNWWQQLFTLIFIGKAWYVGWGALIIGSAALYILDSRKKKRQSTQRKEADRIRRFQDATIKLGEKEK